MKRVPKGPWRGSSAPLVAAMLLLHGAFPARAQTLGQGTGPDISILGVLGALVLCLAVAVLAAFVLKARTRGRALSVQTLFGRSRSQEGRLRVVETLRLGPQVDLCIVECDASEYLIAISGNGASLLSRLPADPESGEQP